MDYYFPKKENQFYEGGRKRHTQVFLLCKIIVANRDFCCSAGEAKMHHTSFEMQLIRNSIVCVSICGKM